MKPAYYAVGVYGKARKLTAASARFFADGPALAARAFSVFYELRPTEIVIVRDRAGRTRRYEVGRRPNIIRTLGVDS